jgi:hypothetical protein
MLSLTDGRFNQVYSCPESPRIIAEDAENHASSHLQRPTESEVNAAGISPSQCIEIVYLDYVSSRDSPDASLPIAPRNNHAAAV